MCQGPRGKHCGLDVPVYTELGYTDIPNIAFAYECYVEPEAHSRITPALKLQAQQAAVELDLRVKVANYWQIYPAGVYHTYIVYATSEKGEREKSRCGL